MVTPMSGRSFLNKRMNHSGWQSRDMDGRKVREGQDEAACDRKVSYEK